MSRVTSMKVSPATGGECRRAPRRGQPEAAGSGRWTVAGGRLGVRRIEWHTLHTVGARVRAHRMAHLAHRRGTGPGASNWHNLHTVGGMGPARRMAQLAHCRSMGPTRRMAQLAHCRGMGPARRIGTTCTPSGHESDAPNGTPCTLSKHGSGASNGTTCTPSEAWNRRVEWHTLHTVRGMGPARRMAHLAHRRGATHRPPPTGHRPPRVRRIGTTCTLSERIVPGRGGPRL